MLSKFAVKKFLERDRDSFNWLKKLSRKQLLAMVNDLDPPPKFISKKKLWKHQLVAFLIGIYVPQFLFLLDMGLGKTRVILELIAYRRRAKLNGGKPALVVVPYTSAVESWVMEVEEHRSDLRCIPMYGNTKSRLKLLDDKQGVHGDLFIISYPALRRLCCKLKANKNKKVGKRKANKNKKVGKRKLVISKSRLRRIAKKFDMICLDESTSIMHHQSTTYRVCNQFSRIIENRYGLTGTPFGRDPQVLWPQFYFIDRGETLGETLMLFRQAFFDRKDDYWSGGFKYVFNKDKEKQLNNFLQNRSIFYSEDECKDIPKRLPKPIYVPFTDDMQGYYRSVVSRLKSERSNFRLVKNSYHNMRQIASGFIGLVDDETGAKAQIEFRENPKMEALLQVLSEIPPDRKFVIFHEYVWTGDRISQELTKAGYRHERLHGKQKDSPRAIRRFREDDDVRGMLVNNKSGAFVHNFQVANYLIFFESPVSPIIRRQAEKRVHRGGQKRRCFIIDIIMKGNSADENIQVYLKQGKNLFESLMKGKAKL